MLLKGGVTVKSLSTAFLADLEEDWRRHGKEIFPILRKKYFGLLACDQAVRTTFRTPTARRGTGVASSGD